MSLQKAKPVQAHLMPGSFFKSIQSKKPKAVYQQQAKNPVNVPQGQLKNNEPNVPDVFEMSEMWQQTNSSYDTEVWIFAT